MLFTGHGARAELEQAVRAEGDLGLDAVLGETWLAHICSIAGYFHE